MGASQSYLNNGSAQRTTRMEAQQEDEVPAGMQPKQANRIEPYVPPRPPPTMKRVETFEEKAYRKFQQQPLVPIGCMITAYFLGSGIKSFYQRDSARSQRMMRARVGAQFATLLTFVAYVGFESFDTTLAPMYQKAQQKKKAQQQQQEQQDDVGKQG